MAARKKDKSQVKDRAQEFNASIDALVDALMEENNEVSNGLESFEMQVQRIRNEMHEAMEDFKSTFLQGYEVILGELARQQAVVGSGSVEKLPSNKITT